MQLFKAIDILPLLNSDLTAEEIDYLQTNVSIFSSSGQIYPLRKSTLGEVNLDLIITVSSKHSAQLLKKVSPILRNLINMYGNILSKHFYYQAEIKEFYKHRDNGCLDNAIDACLEQIKIAPEAVEEFRTETIANKELIEQFEKSNAELKKESFGNDSLSKIMNQMYNDNLKEIEKLKNKKPKSWKSYKGPVHVGYKQLCIIFERQGKYEEALNLAKQAKKEKWNEDWDKRIEKYQKKLT